MSSDAAGGVGARPWRTLGAQWTLVTSGHFRPSAQATASVRNRKCSWSDAQHLPASVGTGTHCTPVGLHSPGMAAARLRAPSRGDIMVVHYLCPVMRGPRCHYSVMPRLTLVSSSSSELHALRTDSQSRSCPCSRERGWQGGCWLVHHPILTPAQARGWGAAGVLVCAPKPQPGTRVRSNLVTHLLWNESTCGRGLFSASL